MKEDLPLQEETELERCVREYGSFSREQLRGIFSRELVIPKHSKHWEKLFGKENINLLSQVFGLEEVIELDCMLLQGELNEVEFREYISQLPEYHELQRLLLELADGFVSTLAPKLDYYLQKSKKKLEPDNGPHMLFVEMEKLLRLFYTEPPSVFRTLCLDLFAHRFQQMLTWVLNNTLDNKEYHDYPESLIAQIMALAKIYIEEGGLRNFSAVSMYQSMGKMIDILSINSAKFNKLLDESEYSSKNDEEIELEAEIKCADILQESLIKKIEKHEVSIGDCKLQLKGDDLWKGNCLERAYKVCVGRMFFDPKENYEELLVTEEYGQSKINLSQSDKSLIFALDRITGELVILDTSFPIWLFLEDKHDYYVFKNIVLDEILNYLKQKEADLEQLLVSSSNAESNSGGTVEPKLRDMLQKSELGESVHSAEGVDTVEETNCLEKTRYLDPKHKARRNLRKSVNIIENVLSAGESNTQTAPQVSFDWSSFPTIKKKEFKAALDKILGGAIRCNATTHYIYRGPNDKTVPVPFGDGDIGIGLLKKIIKTLGLEPQEVLEAL